MSNVAHAATATSEDMTGLPGAVTASLLTVTLVSAFVGGFAGMALDEKLAPLALAIVAGFLGTLAASVSLRTILTHAWNAEAFGTAIDIVALTAVTSLLGSFMAYQMISATGPIWSGVTGMLAGLISAVLMGFLMIAAHRDTEPMDKRH